ncbi:hypothetical protein HK100_009717, partial [Physocladia obscura]
MAILHLLNTSKNVDLKEIKSAMCVYGSAGYVGSLDVLHKVCGKNKNLAVRLTRLCLGFKYEDDPPDAIEFAKKLMNLLQEAGL